MKKRRDGHANFLKSHYDEAIRNFSEGILLLPNVDMYAKDRMQFYWKRAECYLKKVSITVWLLLRKAFPLNTSITLFLQGAWRVILTISSKMPWKSPTVKKLKIEAPVRKLNIVSLYWENYRGLKHATVLGRSKPMPANIHYSQYPTWKLMSKSNQSIRAKIHDIISLHCFVLLNPLLRRRFLQSCLLG